MTKTVGVRPGHPLVLAAGSMLDCSDSELIGAAAKAGFDAVGVRLSAGTDFGAPARTAAEIEATRADAERLGMRIHDVEVHRISSPGVDPGWLIDQTAALGAAYLLVVSDLADTTETTRALSDVTERAGRDGVRVGLEYMAWTNPGAPLEAIEMAHRADCELVVDVLHHHRVGAGGAEFDAIVQSGRLGWLQLCDAAMRPPDSGGREALIQEALIQEARHGRLLPGRGELPVSEILALIPQDTTVSVEVQSDDLLALQPDVRAELLHHSARSVLDRPPQSPNKTG